MKKFLAILLIAILSMSATALAATYSCDDLTFEYNEDFFEITMDDHADDGCLVILTDKNDGFVRIHLGEIGDDEAFPTAEELSELWGVEVEKLDEWGNFKDVLSYEIEEDGDDYESVFIAPIYDDGEIDEILTVTIGGTLPEDEAAVEESSNFTSEVVDTLKVNQMAEGADNDWYMDVLADEAIIAEYPYHAFADINDNGVPVLLISTTQESFIGNEDTARVYLYSDGTAKQVMEVGGGGGDAFYCNFDEGTLTHFYRVSGEEHIEVYRAEDGELVLVTKADAYEPNHGPNGDNAEVVYYQDDQEIDEETAGSLWDTYATDSALSYEPMD